MVVVNAKTCYVSGMYFFSNHHCHLRFATVAAFAIHPEPTLTHENCGKRLNLEPLGGPWRGVTIPLGWLYDGDSQYAAASLPGNAAPQPRKENPRKHGGLRADMMSVDPPANLDSEQLGAARAGNARLPIVNGECELLPGKAAPRSRQGSPRKHGGKRADVINVDPPANLDSKQLGAAVAGNAGLQIVKGECPERRPRGRVQKVHANKAA